MKLRCTLLFAWLCLMQMPAATAQSELLSNVYGRRTMSLGGTWDAIVDPYDQGYRMKVWENRTPQSNDDFYEYRLDGGLRLDVPGDWNSQHPALDYYEGTVWYVRRFDADGDPTDGNRRFLYFAGVNYRCTVWLNGTELVSHEGGFTPFQAEVGEWLKPQDNLLVVAVNNRRSQDAIPALAFDWWNYGGITRDVLLVTVPGRYIADWFVRLDNKVPDTVLFDVRLSEGCGGEKVNFAIPELKIDRTLTTDAEGRISGRIKAKNLQRWSTADPKRYEVVLRTASDRVSDKIGFRTIAVEGTKILLNGQPEFLRSISFHEEIPQRRGRAFSQADALQLLTEAKDLGANMVRLAHYPQNEYIVRTAERMGILLWEEIPVWQGIDFADTATQAKALRMQSEMIARDKNRCAVCFWGVANETKPSPERNAFVRRLLQNGRSLDDSRLFTAAFDLVYFDAGRQLFTMRDPLTDDLDVVAVNKYLGWYHPWEIAPEKATWDVAPDKPLMISEFGGEALYGRAGDGDRASSWSEDYQAKLYRDNLEMFANIPNLCGISPWILYDFRSPYRFHPEYQEGWNRKGLVSDRGYRKKAWYIIRDLYAAEGENPFHLHNK